MLYAALPRLMLQGQPSTTELTSGGKFAARVPEAAQAPDAATMPAPRRLLLPGMSDIETVVLPVSAPNWDATALRVPSVLATPARLPKPGRASARSQARHDADAAAAETPRPSLADQGPAGGEANCSLLAGGPAETTVLKLAQGTLPKLLSSAQTLWSMTAAASGSLLARVMR
jgi:hypothetical protein